MKFFISPFLYPNCGAASETTKIRPQILEKFDLEFLQRSIGRTVGVHMERATRACHATPKVLIDWRRSLGSQSLLAQLDKSPVAAALTTAGGIATWCSNRKRPFPDTGDMGAYMCVDHPTSNSRALVAAATTTAGGIATRCNRKRPPPAPAKTLALRCVHHRAFKSRAFFL